jgi:hypothetical protein
MTSEAISGDAEVLHAVGVERTRFMERADLTVGLATVIVSRLRGQTGGIHLSVAVRGRPSL